MTASSSWPPTRKVGAPAAPALGLTDPVIDVSITPNRGDAASVYGIARDLAAAGLGTLKHRKGRAGGGQIPQPQEHHARFHAGEQKRLPDFRRPPDPRREERPVAQMGAGPAARRWA